jgi:hypothetical protein
MTCIAESLGALPVLSRSLYQALLESKTINVSVKHQIMSNFVELISNRFKRMLQPSSTRPTSFGMQRYSATVSSGFPVVGYQKIMPFTSYKD